jgi:hypothetical protein
LSSTLQLMVWINIHILVPNTQSGLFALWTIIYHHI